jgi:uncharacterized membrane-anchored protein
MSADRPRSDGTAPGQGLRCLPPDDASRMALHDEVHARPPARIRLPALVTLVAVLNEGVDRAEEHAHLARLPGQQSLPPEAVLGNFLRLRLDGYTVKWERHTEFSRYSLVQPLPASAGLAAERPALLDHLPTPAGWLAAIPGRTVAAVQLVMVPADLSEGEALMAAARRWLGRRTVLASQIGGGQAWAVTDFLVQPDGFERMLVLAPPSLSEARAGRISMRLLELEIYRLMALRGLPVAKALGPRLASAEAELADLTAQMDAGEATEQALLDRLIGLAARVERATAAHSFRFSATRAYADLVAQRFEELREQPLPGQQTLGGFMRRRLSPAIATVASTAQRLASLSERITRTSALLRTRVDIASEGQNQLLLAKLTRGQELQLRLQSTVEGLSIAAISYYMISLLLYGAKALKALGLPLHPELAAGVLVPVVVWGVWRLNRRIHDRLHAEP